MSSTKTSGLNIDQGELNKFKHLAASWWDPEGKLKSLHDINPLRLGFICDHTDLSNKTLLDIGCGGGLLTEACAKKGAKCTGIDANKSLIDVAKLHALESELEINYYHTTIESFANTNNMYLDQKQVNNCYDTIICMELLEHVPRPQELIHHLSSLLAPKGKLFLSTINRTPIAYLKAIIAAEHILKLLPKGTHEYEKFIKPSELRSWCEPETLELKAMQGMSYNPITKQYFLTQNTSVNYLAYFQKC